MKDILSIRESLCRLESEGLHISEYALRRLIREGQVHVRYVGLKKALIYYPSLVRYLTGMDEDR